MKSSESVSIGSDTQNLIQPIQIYMTESRIITASYFANKIMPSDWQRRLHF